MIDLLDFTSVVTLLTFTDKALDVKKDGYQALSELDATLQGEYDPEAYHGAPVAIQITSRRLSERVL